MPACDHLINFPSRSFSRRQKNARTVFFAEILIKTFIRDNNCSECTQTKTIGQIVDLILGQEQVGKAVQFSDGVRKSFEFVVGDVQLCQFLQCSDLLQSQHAANTYGNQFNVSLRFSDHFPGEPGLAGVY